LIIYDDGKSKNFVVYGFTTLHGDLVNFCGELY
jgi:hypothetical protein